VDEIYAFLANSKDPEGPRLAACHLNRMKVIYDNGFNEAKRLAMEECSKYIDRMRAAAASTEDLGMRFEFRDRIAGATSCKAWIEMLKEPA